MVSKHILAISLIVGMIAGTSTAISGEPKIHDHQQKKTHIKSSDNTKSAGQSDCDQPDSTENEKSDAKDTLSGEKSANCAPKKDQEKRHDHREMKNL